MKTNQFNKNIYHKSKP